MWARHSACAFTRLCKWRVSHRWLLTLDPSRFKHIVDHLSETCVAYGDDPLAKIPEQRRGMLLETLSRGMLQRSYPDRRVQNACSSLTCVNGRRRDTRTAEWDCTLGSQRAELKSAKLCFVPGLQTWRVSFQNVKLMKGGDCPGQPFDELYLLIYTPGSFYLLQHDLQTGVSTRGARTQTQGHVITVYGRCGQTFWKDALDTILTKLMLRGSCELVREASKTDSQVLALYADLLLSTQHFSERAYEDVPLSQISPSTRALRVQQIAMEIDKMEHPDGIFTNASGEMVDGRRRGSHNAAVDWIRDGVRIEVKHAKVRFDPGPARWRCTFANIKHGSTNSSCNAYFDELWLVMYSPGGLDLFKHPRYCSNLSSRGVSTLTDGKALEVLGQKDQLCVKASVQRITAKLEAAHAEHFCTIPWEK